MCSSTGPFGANFEYYFSFVFHFVIFWKKYWLVATKNCGEKHWGKSIQCYQYIILHFERVVQVQPHWVQSHQENQRVIFFNAKVQNVLFWASDPSPTPLTSIPSANPTGIIIVLHIFLLWDLETKDPSVSPSTTIPSTKPVEDGNSYFELNISEALPFLPIMHFVSVEDFDGGITHALP